MNEIEALYRGFQMAQEQKKITLQIEKLQLEREALLRYAEKSTAQVKDGFRSDMLWLCLQLAETFGHKDSSVDLKLEIASQYLRGFYMKHAPRD